MPALSIGPAATRAVSKCIRECLAALAILLSFWSTDKVQAAEMRLLSAASIQEVFKEIIGDFERSSGHKVIIHYGTMGAITEWVRGGEEADMVISSLQSISALVKAGKIDASSQITISRVGAGIVVPSGEPPVIVASVEDFKRALIAAKTIVYADPSRGGAAGIHIAAHHPGARSCRPVEVEGQIRRWRRYHRSHTYAGRRSTRHDPNQRDRRQTRRGLRWSIAERVTKLHGFLRRHSIWSKTI